MSIITYLFILINSFYKRFIIFLLSTKKIHFFRQQYYTIYIDNILTITNYITTRIMRLQLSSVKHKKDTLLQITIIINIMTITN